MITMEPVLKRGYAAWDRDVLPADEYAARVDAVRAAMRAAGLMGVVVVNHSLLGVMVDYADMAYLSGLQSGGVLLVARDGDPAFISFGGGRELAFLRTQTWIADVIPGGRDAFGILREQLRGRGIERGAIGTVGVDGLAANPGSRLDAALAGYEPRSFDAELRRLRAAKRPREVLAVRIAQGIVAAGVEAARAAFAAGRDDVAAMIEAERTARALKARDVRVLASMGGAELRPFEGRLEGWHAPLRLWIGAQYQGYWAEAAATFPLSAGNPAERAVSAMQAAAAPGRAARDVAAAALAALPREAAESALAYGLGGTIGLALAEGLAIAPDRDDPLPDGALLALRCVAAGPEPCIASRVVAVADGGARALEPLRL
jgi:Xaa-Pro aminopeptidase